MLVGIADKWSGNLTIFTISLGYLQLKFLFQKSREQKKIYITFTTPTLLLIFVLKVINMIKIKICMQSFNIYVFFSNVCNELIKSC